MRSLRSYLMIMVTALVLLLSVGAALLLHQFDRAARSRAEGQLVDNTRALSSALDGELNRAISILNTLRAAGAVQRGDWKGVDRQARVAFRDSYAWVMVADRSGQQIVNTRLPPGAPLPHGTVPANVWRELDRDRPHICDLTQGVLAKRIICVDVPVMRQGRAAYVFSIIIEPRHFETFLARQRLDAGRVVSLIDRNGVLVWRSLHPERFLGTRIPDEMLSAIRSAPSGLRYSTSLDGVKMAAAFDRSQVSGWTVISGLPASGMRSAFDRAALVGLAGALSCLALAAAAAVFVTRRLSEAVRGLTEASMRFRDGAPTVFVPSGLSEIDAVGAVLDEAFAARQASDERFALAQEVGGIGAWDWDTVNDLGTVSETYREMHGLSAVAGPLRIADVRRVIHPDDLAGYDQRLIAARGRSEASTNDYRVVHPDGSIRWIAAKGRPMRDEQGRYIRAVGIVRDVTLEREAQQELARLNRELEGRIVERTAQLEESERRFRAIFDTAFQLTSLTTLDGTILVANQAALDAAEADLDAVIGRKIWQSPWWLADRDEAERVRASVHRAAEGAFVRYESTLSLPAGRRQFDFSMKPVRDAQGQAIFLVAEGRDITDLKQAEAALTQSQKLESMGQLTGGVAHDFNNLLTPIVGSLDLIHRRKIGSEREQRLVEAALQSAEKARTLVQRLLAFARRQPLQAEAVNAAALVHGIVDLVAATIGPRITLHLDVESDLALVHADANQIEMAILNLVVNARDAMPDGGKLTVSVKNADAGAKAPPELQPGRYVCICVADTGEGMDAETARRAIEPFFSTKGVGQGTGLGLSMVHGLAAQLNGALVIESAPGEGTAVHLWLPVVDEELAPAAKAEAPAQLTASGTVLLVDDDDLVRQSTAAMLHEIGLDVIEAVSAEQAMRMVEAGVAFDCLVTDYLMPGSSGGDLVRWLAEARPGTPALVITGYAGEDGLPNGAAVLGKPFRKDELAAVVADVLGRARPSEGSQARTFEAPPA